MQAKSVPQYRQAEAIHHAIRTMCQESRIDQMKIPKQGAIFNNSPGTRLNEDIIDFLQDWNSNLELRPSKLEYMPVREGDDPTVYDSASTAMCGSNAKSAELRY